MTSLSTGQRTMLRKIAQNITSRNFEVRPPVSFGDDDLLWKWVTTLSTGRRREILCFSDPYVLGTLKAMCRVLKETRSKGGEGGIFVMMEAWRKRRTGARTLERRSKKDDDTSEPFEFRSFRSLQWSPFRKKANERESNRVAQSTEKSEFNLACSILDYLLLWSFKSKIEVPDTLCVSHVLFENIDDVTRLRAMLETAIAMKINISVQLMEKAKHDAIEDASHVTPDQIAGTIKTRFEAEAMTLEAFFATLVLERLRDQYQCLSQKTSSFVTSGQCLAASALEKSLDSGLNLWQTLRESSEFSRHVQVYSQILARCAPDGLAQLLRPTERRATTESNETVNSEAQMMRRKSMLTLELMLTLPFLHEPDASAVRRYKKRREWFLQRSECDLLHEYSATNSNSGEESNTHSKAVKRRRKKQRARARNRRQVATSICIDIIGDVISRAVAKSLYVARKRRMLALREERVKRQVRNRVVEDVRALVVSIGCAASRISERSAHRRRRALGRSARAALLGSRAASNRVRALVTYLEHLRRDSFVGIRSTDSKTSRIAASNSDDRTKKVTLLKRAAEGNIDTTPQTLQHDTLLHMNAKPRSLSSSTSFVSSASKAPEKVVPVAAMSNMPVWASGRCNSLYEWNHGPRKNSRAHVRAVGSMNHVKETWPLSESPAAIEPKNSLHAKKRSSRRTSANPDSEERKIDSNDEDPWSRIAWDLTQDILDMTAAFARIAKRRRPFQLAVVNAVRAIVNRLWPSARVEVFGSLGQGLSIPSSDVDLVVCDVYEHIEQVLRQSTGQATSCVQMLAALLREQEWVRNVQTVVTAKVPIIKAKTFFEELGAGGVALDISFDMPAHRGLATCAFVRNLRSVYPALVPLTLVLKQFLVAKGLNDPYTGGLSSYGILLMVAAVLDEAEHLHPARRDHRHQHQSDAFGRIQWPMNLGSLLILFLRVYVNHFDPSKHGISMRRAIAKRSPVLGQIRGGADSAAVAAGEDRTGLIGASELSPSQFVHLQSRPSPSPHELMASNQLGLGIVLGRCFFSRHRQWQRQMIDFQMQQYALAPHRTDMHRFPLQQSRDANALLVIKDPFNPNNNVGRSCFGIYQVRAELERALRAIGDFIDREKDLSPTERSNVRTKFSALGAFFSTDHHRRVVKLAEHLYSPAGVSTAPPSPRVSRTLPTKTPPPVDVSAASKYTNDGFVSAAVDGGTNATMSSSSSLSPSSSSSLQTSTCKATNKVGNDIFVDSDGAVSIKKDANASKKRIDSTGSNVRDTRDPGDERVGANVSLTAQTCDTRWSASRIRKVLPRILEAHRNEIAPTLSVNQKNATNAIHEDDETSKRDLSDSACVDDGGDQLLKDLVESSFTTSATEQFVRTAFDCYVPKGYGDHETLMNVLRTLEMMSESLEARAYLWKLILRTTIDAIEGLFGFVDRLESIDEKKSTKIRTQLKILGRWLGLITLGRNKALLSRDLDLTSIVEGPRIFKRMKRHDGIRSQSRYFLIAVPFVAKVLTAAADSHIFRPPNPWTVSLMRSLRRHYNNDRASLSLKFEVEVLFHLFEVDIKDSRCFDSLVSSTRQHTSVEEDALVRRIMEHVERRRVVRDQKVKTVVALTARDRDGNILKRAEDAEGPGRSVTDWAVSCWKQLSLMAHGTPAHPKGCAGCGALPRKTHAENCPLALLLETFPLKSNK